MFAVDLNCDLGESFGNYKCGLDEEVIPFISSANVACGFHASDPVVMAKTVALAKKQGVRVGAHPGYPDMMGFGRRKMVLQKKSGSIAGRSKSNGAVSDRGIESILHSTGN